MKNNNIDTSINIVYATDDNFADVMGISIISLFINNPLDSFNIYILDSGVSDKNKQNVNRIFQTHSRELPHWIPAVNINDILGIEVKQDRGSISQFARIFISRLLPHNLKRILYFDCDTIICNSIRELWELEMEGNTIAALADPFSKYYRRNLGLREDALLFNSGIMLIDVLRWKEIHVEEKLLKLIKDYNGLIPQGDQGALCAILSSETKVLEPKFNSITLFYDFSYNELIKYRKPPKEYYSENDIQQARREPVIVHFTTSFISLRPWYTGSVHPYAKRWLEYRSESPWKSEPLREPPKYGFLKSMYIMFCKFMPRKLMVFVSGILQAYGRPLLLKYKYKI